MAVGSLSPVAIQQFSDANGDPLAGGKLFFYEAGTSTPSPAYANFELTIPLANPVVLDAGGYAPELFLDAKSYKCVLTDANDVTIWTADNIVTAAALRTGQSTISLTGLQHDVPVPVGIISFIEFRNATLLTIDGFSGGTPGQILILRALGEGQVNLINADSSTSLPSSAMINHIASGPTSLVGVVPGYGGAGTATYVKAANGYWILTAHEQGGVIRVPFSAANFWASAGEWTVEDADVQYQEYYLRGSILLVTASVQGSAVTGAPTELLMGGWPYKWRSGVGFLPTIIITSAGSVGGLMSGPSNNSHITFQHVGFTPITAGAVSVFTQVSIEVM